MIWISGSLKFRRINSIKNARVVQILRFIFCQPAVIEVFCHSFFVVTNRRISYMSIFVLSPTPFQFFFSRFDLLRKLLANLIDRRKKISHICCCYCRKRFKRSEGIKIFLLPKCNQISFHRNRKHLGNFFFQTFEWNELTYLQWIWPKNLIQYEKKTPFWNSCPCHFYALNWIEYDIIRRDYIETKQKYILDLITEYFFWIITSFIIIYRSLKKFHVGKLLIVITAF